MLEAERPRRLVGAEHEKIEILEGAEQREMQPNRDPEHDLAALRVPCRADDPPGEIGQRGAEPEQKAEAPIPLCIEVVAGDNQHRLLRREALFECRDDSGHSKKEQEKMGSREQHSLSRRQAAQTKGGPPTSASPGIPAAA